jgi:hypothetical protein
MGFSSAFDGIFRLFGDEFLGLLMELGFGVQRQLSILEP